MYETYTLRQKSNYADIRIVLPPGLGKMRVHVQKKK